MNYTSKNNRINTLKNIYRYGLKYLKIKKRMEKEKYKPLLDFSPEAVAIRREKIKKDKILAENVWKIMDNEGGEIEKSYWIKGFMVGLNHNK